MFANEQTIQEITRRLVDFYRPVRVYLFGSVARGDSGPHSDLDFCVVLQDDAPGEVFRAGASRLALAGIGVAAGVIPWRRTDFERRAAWLRHPCQRPLSTKGGFFMNPNEMREREMREWLEKALDDLESTRILAEADHAANALYHCQQAAENALKGFSYIARPTISENAQSEGTG